MNGTEISVHQLRVGGAGTNPASAAQALEKVIDRELLVQKALAAKLDRDPQVQQSIENARRQLLAQAYLERTASAGAGSTRDEVRAFYAENPALFAERRIYRLRELTVSAPPDMVDVLRAEAVKARDLDELGAWLRVRNAKYSVDAVEQPAEQLPLSFLPRLAAHEAGRDRGVRDAAGRLGDPAAARRGRAAHRAAGGAVDRAISGRTPTPRNGGGRSEAAARGGDHRISGRIQERQLT